jgi:hypothetical protein
MDRVIRRSGRPEFYITGDVAVDEKTTMSEIDIRLEAKRRKSAAGLTRLDV